MTTPTTVNARFQLRADTAANWASVNPTLLTNELGLETDTKRLKVGNGSTAWNSLAYFPSIVSGGTVLGNLEIGTTGTLTFEGSTADGFETTLAVTNPTADRTITLPNQSGTVLVSGNASIVDADIAANAEIAVSKLADGAARQLLQTDAAGTGVEWTSNIDIPGTLDVTGAATFDNNVTITGDLTVNGTTTNINTQNLVVEDKNIILGDVATPTDVTADGGGITLKGATDKTINWVDSTDAWTSSERFSVPLGSAGAPSLTFTGDPNTGIYSPGADQVALSTNGTGRLFVDANGNVVAGETGATSFNSGTGIQVQRDGVACVRVFNNTGGKAGELYADATAVRLDSRGTSGFLAFDIGGSEAMRITNSGRLLVGTSSSATVGNGQHRLQIAGTTSEAISVFLGDSTTAAASPLITLGRSRNTAYGSFTAVQNNDSLGRIAFVGDNGANYQLQAARIEAQVDGAVSGGGANDMPGRLVFSTTADGASSPTERMRIDSSGRVGIGTTSPVYPLSVQGSGATPGRVYLGNSLEGLATGTNNGGAIYFGVEPTSSTAPTAGIEASWGGGLNPQIHMGVTRDGTKSRISFFSDNTARIYTTNTERFRIDASGTVNVIAPSSTVPFIASIGGSEVARIDSSGRLLVGTSSVTANNAISVVQGRSDSTTAGGSLLIAKGPGDPADGGALGDIRFSGNNHISSATIVANRDGGTWTAGSSQPSRLVFSTTADGASSPTERLRITNDGVQAYNQPAPAAVNATATLTVANLKAGIITSTSAAATDMTLPTGTDTQAGFSGTYDNFTFEWSVINTGPSLVRVLAATAHTIVGSGSVATGTSGRFASRRTAANTFVTYRLC